MAETVLSALFERLMRAGIIVTGDWATLRFFEEAPWSVILILLGISGVAFAVLERKESLKERGWYATTLVIVAAAYVVVCGYAYHTMPPSGHSQPLPGVTSAPMPSETFTPAAPKVDKPSYPPRLAGDADKEIQVIDNFSEILRKEAMPQPQEGRDILSQWQDALDDVKQPIYFQSVAQYRNKVSATNDKIWDMLQQYQQYCDNDLCAMIDPRQNINLTDAFVQLRGMLVGLRGIIDPSIKRSTPTLAQIVAPWLDRVGTQIFAYDQWITEARNKLSERRKELGKAGR
jgi:hypothetical protein